MKVLWIHNFNPKYLNSGCFVFESKKAAELAGINIDLHYLGNLRNPINIVKQLYALNRKSKEYDLVHAQYGSMASFILGLSNCKNKVVTIRGNDWHLHSETLGMDYFHTRLARFLTRISLNKITKVICVSHELKRLILARRPMLSISCLPSSIDLNKFIPLQKRKKKKYKTILFNAQNINEPRKRFWLAKEIIKKLRKKTKFKIKFKAITNVPHKYLPKLISNADCILCVSESEGWPNCIKEALACNVPFVSSNISDLRTVAKNTTNCFVTKSLNPEKVSDVLLKSLQLPHDNTLRNIVKSMAHLQSGRKLRQIYLDIIKKQCVE